MSMMDTRTVDTIASRWSHLTDRVLSLEKLPPDELWGLLRDTYRTLHHYHRCALVPKEAAKLLLGMNHYLYFSTLMEIHEVPENTYCYQAVSAVAEAMTEGFFWGEYICDYPMLQVTDATGERHILDLEQKEDTVAYLMRG